MFILCTTNIMFTCLFRTAVTRFFLLNNRLAIIPSIHHKPTSVPHGTTAWLKFPRLRLQQ